MAPCVPDRRDRAAPAEAFPFPAVFATEVPAFFAAVFDLGAGGFFAATLVFVAGAFDFAPACDFVAVVLGTEVALDLAAVALDFSAGAFVFPEVAAAVLGVTALLPTALLFEGFDLALVVERLCAVFFMAVLAPAELRAVVLPRVAVLPGAALPRVAAFPAVALLRVAALPGAEGPFPEVLPEDARLLFAAAFFGAVFALETDFFERERFFPAAGFLTVAEFFAGAFLFTSFAFAAATPLALDDRLFAAG